MPYKRNYALASLTLLASVATLAVAGASQAQVPPAGAAGARQGPPAELRAKIEQRGAARRVERNKDLAMVLRLRPDQMPALDAFVSSQTPRRPDGVGRGPGPGAGPRGPRGAEGPPVAPLTTPQKLDREAQRGQMRQAFEQQRAQGLRTFYAALNPEQQQVFDALGRLRDTDGARMMVNHGRRGFEGPRGPGGPPPPRG